MHERQMAEHRVTEPGPEHEVARWFMARKGYVAVRPVDVTKLKGVSCWYFSYDLHDEGHLELEVSWNEATQEWETLVTTFALAE